MNWVHLDVLNSNVMSQLGVSAKIVSETVKYTQDKHTSDEDVPKQPTEVGGRLLCLPKQLCQS